MAVKWTEEQQRVIDTHGENLLVSAAAGSGKTAVLVARILAMITDPRHPVDIDRLLVVTFTNAAAAEMRGRIRDALEERAQREPENEHLQRQLVLVHNAKITTIHSFCLQVLRSHFQMAGIDPSFRIADEGEVLLLEQDAAQETVNAAYEEESPQFLEFLEQLATGREDREIGELILQLYHFALGQPFPEEWLAECRAMYGETEGPAKEIPPESREESAGKQLRGWGGAEHPAWLTFVEEDTAMRLADIRAQIEAALAIAGEPDGPYPYEKALTADLELVDSLTGVRNTPRTWAEYSAAFAKMGGFARLSPKKDPAVTEEKKQRVQAMRAEWKDELAALREQYYYDAPDALQREFARSGLIVRELTRLTEDFMARIAAKKAEKNVLDFSDLEHFALKILIERVAEPGNTSGIQPTAAEPGNAPGCRLTGAEPGNTSGIQPTAAEQGNTPGVQPTAVEPGNAPSVQPTAAEPGNAPGCRPTGAERGNTPGWRPTAAAREYAESFAEIMTDEYQDSNLVQEMILTSIAGAASGANNRFMVGDVKQSIYRFRLARPELFMEKYRSYRSAGGPTGNARTDCGSDVRTGGLSVPGSSGENGVRIDLHRNFRSRRQVLAAVNGIFRQIMTEALGGVSYDADAALYQGAEFPEAPGKWLSSGECAESRSESSSEPSSEPGKELSSGERAESCSESSSEPSSEPGKELSVGECAESRSESSSESSSEPDPGSPSGDCAASRSPWYDLEFLLADGRADDMTGASEEAGEGNLGSPGSDKNGEDASAPVSLREAEARLVGQKILELAGTMPVLDKETGGFRPARFGDIVILLRTVSGWAETFGEVLSDMGIPCFTGSREGYFSAAEIRVVLSYLRILDNPLQDIPLVAVLRSAIGEFDDEELSQIRVNAPEEEYFWDCCRNYRENGEQEEIREKLGAFFGIYGELRAKCAYTPVHLLLWELLDMTGYGEYAAALPGGRQRQANLDMLVEKAIAYEATSYRGLYHFVRYIENLQKYEVDFGEAGLGAEAQHTVRIMSIHKSKGLEFPIVFVSGLGKRFNQSDVRSRVVMHPDFGIGCDCVDTMLRTRQETLLKKMVQRKTVTENLGEELRVLYVAMTRAKEKLILTGGVKDPEKSLAAWRSDAEYEGGTLSYSALSGASSYLDWLVPALLRFEDGQELLAECGLPPVKRKNRAAAVKEPDTDRRASCQQERGSSAGVQLPGRHGPEQNPGKLYFTARLVSGREQFARESLQRTEDFLGFWELQHLDSDVCQDEQARERLEKVFTSVYPYEKNREIPGKVSVSELKKLSQMSEEPDAVELYPSKQEILPGQVSASERESAPGAAKTEEAPGQNAAVVPLVPDFIREAAADAPGPEPLQGAARGTAYHTFMENLDFSKKELLQYQLEELISCGKMTRDEAEALRLLDFRDFLRTKLAARMERAQAAGMLYREQPFVLGVAADRLRSDWDPGETVLIQGIIDAYFIEDGGIVLLDYKTDRVSDGGQLVNRYRAQLEYYAEALERLTGCPVRERYLYSFCLGRALKVPPLRQDRERPGL